MLSRLNKSSSDKHVILLLDVDETLIYRKNKMLFWNGATPMMWRNMLLHLKQEGLKTTPQIHIHVGFATFRRIKYGRDDLFLSQPRYPGLGKHLEDLIDKELIFYANDHGEYSKTSSLIRAKRIIEDRYNTFLTKRDIFIADDMRHVTEDADKFGFNSIEITYARTVDKNAVYSCFHSLFKHAGLDYLHWVNQESSLYNGIEITSDVLLNYSVTSKDLLYGLKKLNPSEFTLSLCYKLFKTKVSILNEPIIKLIESKLTKETFDNLFELEKAGLNYLLRSAVDEGNCDLVRYLLQMGIDGDQLDENGKSILYSAVYLEHQAIVELLLEKNIALKSNADGSTAFSSVRTYDMIKLLSTKIKPSTKDKDSLNYFFKQSYDNPNYAAMLLELGADIDACNDLGNSVLIMAVFYNQVDVVKLLLERGADPALFGLNGFTALTWAVINNNDTIVKAMLATGIEAVVSPNQDGTTALAYSRNYSMLKFLQNKIPAVKQDDIRISNRLSYWRDGKESPLITAVKQNAIGAIKFLLANDSDASCWDSNGLTALSCAAVRGSEEMLSIFLNSPNADIFALNADGTTAASRAVNHKMLELLLTKIELNAEDKAYFNNQLFELVKDNDLTDNHLILGLADVNSVDSNGNTPLIVAAMSGYEKMLKLLLTRNADPARHGQDGLTALTQAFIHQKERIIEVLVKSEITGLWNKNADGTDAFNPSPRFISDEDQHHEWVNACVFKYTKLKQPVIARFFVNAYTNVNAQDEQGCTLLMLAARTNNREFIVFLLERGVNPALTDKNGKTALSYASSCAILGLLTQKIVPTRADVKVFNDKLKLLNANPCRIKGDWKNLIWKLLARENKKSNTLSLEDEITVANSSLSKYTSVDTRSYRFFTQMNQPQLTEFLSEQKSEISLTK